MLLPTPSAFGGIQKTKKTRAPPVLRRHPLCAYGSIPLAHPTLVPLVEPGDHCVQLVLKQVGAIGTDDALNVFVAGVNQRCQ